MAAYRQVCDSRHLQADCQEPGSASEPYARQSSMGYLFACVCDGGTEGPTYSANERVVQLVGTEGQRLTVDCSANGSRPISYEFFKVDSTLSLLQSFDI